jgi:hypothetical protein
VHPSFPQQGNTISLDPQTQAQLRAYIQAQVHAVQANNANMDNKMYNNPMISVQSNGMLGKKV